MDEKKSATVLINPRITPSNRDRINFIRYLFIYSRVRGLSSPFLDFPTGPCSRRNEFTSRKLRFNGSQSIRALSQHEGIGVDLVRRRRARNSGPREPKGREYSRNAKKPIAFYGRSLGTSPGL
ncbi:Hypothetical protein NTJ_05264 [Nesidiocoris tenuis]|uniref:Uncharacterized protein n=1 Tax=Nesidiocoris tenuis TaxID=355587 RepID=A0ABN7AJM3_9HEMI|nr:Hypothetical protein NTJ_05264 [Nesidiocoris tenuis]